MSSRSNIGILATRRTPTAADNGSGLTVGVDANMQFFRNLTINSYYARTEAPGRTGDESSYRGRLDYAADRYGLQLEHLLVGDAFRPEVGFTRRTDFRRSTVGARFSPRPRSSRLVRKLAWEASYDYITDAKNTSVENREAQGTFRIEFSSGDQWNLEYFSDFERLRRRQRPRAPRLSTRMRLVARLTTPSAAARVSAKCGGSVPASRTPKRLTPVNLGARRRCPKPANEPHLTFLLPVTFILPATHR